MAKEMFKVFDSLRSQGNVIVCDSYKARKMSLCLTLYVAKEM